MDNSNWQPTATRAMLETRSVLIERIRQYFKAESVLEVETPVLSHFAGTDVHLDQWLTSSGHSLHTSPEFAMKRLLASGSGDIFQLARVFRKDETSARHNAEFTMLEWYRTSIDEHQLMTDVLNLLMYVSQSNQLNSRKLTYKDVFISAQLPNPLLADTSELRLSVADKLNADSHHWSRDDCLNALMSLVVEPSLPKDTVTFIYNFPASQAALAKFGREDGFSVGRRFECFWQGFELANGYNELTDANEQRRRFQQDNEERKARKAPTAKIDERFLAALSSGLPECSGVALGVDRLIMAISGARSIDDVIAFPFERA